jgi:N-acetylneuraminate synthase
MTARLINYVAELSANHNNSLERAHSIIDAVSDAGATSIKLQTYRPETMTLRIDRPEFRVPISNSLWGGRQLFDLYSEAMTPWEWHGELFEHARSLGLRPFSSPFDSSAVDFLETLGCEIYKIASFEVVDTELIAYAAATGKPLIISTGMASLREISVAVEAAEKAGCNDITLLKATSAYPADPSHSNLATMKVMNESFGWPVGISDHTPGIGVAVAAAALGATVIEKHVTLRRSDGGVDSAFSLEPEEFGRLVIESARAREAIGGVAFGPSDGDRESLTFRRSYILTQDVEKGDVLSHANARALRPGGGLAVAEFALFEGLAFTSRHSAGDPVKPDMFKQT